MEQQQRRLNIQRRCEALTELVESLKGTMDSLQIERHLTEVQQIKKNANKEHDEMKMRKLTHQLLALQRQWTELPAGDGEAIISPSRHERFLPPVAVKGLSEE